MVKSITVDGVKIEVPASMVANGGKFEISREGADPVVIDINRSTELAPAAAIAAGASAAGATAGLTLLGLGIGTIINHALSAGTFTNPKEILSSDKFAKKLEKIKSKLGGEFTAASMEEAKSLISHYKSSDFVKTIVKKDDMVVAVMNLANLDLKQVAGRKPIGAFTFIKKKNGKIKAVTICKGYLK